MQQLVVWNLDLQRYAIPFDVVERVVRVVAITPLPEAPRIVRGIVNMQGRLIPVIDARRRFDLPDREIQLSDQLIIAGTRHRCVALLVDGVSGVIDQPDAQLVPSDAITPGMGSIAGVAKLPDGMILIHDLDRCLSLDEGVALDSMLDTLAAKRRGYAL